MDTEKIEFDDGSWWMIRTVLTYGVRRRFREAIAPAWGVTNGTGTNEGEALGGLDVSNPAVASRAASAGEIVRLLGSTTEWSFGEINEATLDDLPAEKIDRVMARIDELHFPRSAEQAAVVKKV